ncbi:hypothetical protein [Lacrimispora sp. BS-2]|uniref:LexA family protein n=1 Tax=Lacrimispora sp. BS-2 TaxID=3151850 RepID=UPI0032EC2DF0
MSKPKLKERQQRILVYIRQIITDRGYPPIVREIVQEPLKWLRMSIHYLLNQSLRFLSLEP